jgi:hypothetical protein
MEVLSVPRNATTSKRNVSAMKKWTPWILAFNMPMTKWVLLNVPDQSTFKFATTYAIGVALCFGCIRLYETLVED